MSDYQLDPYTWFTEREMSNTPKHFVMTKHILTAESKQWVLGESGQFEELYDNFETQISKLPKKEIETYLKECIIDFLNKIKFN